MMNKTEGKAIPFIKLDKNDRFVLSEEAEQLLNSLGNAKLGVISLVGKSHSGKTFFTNRALLNQSEGGFHGGSESCASEKVIELSIISWDKTNYALTLGSMDLESASKLSKHRPW